MAGLADLLKKTVNTATSAVSKANASIADETSDIVSANTTTTTAPTATFSQSYDDYLSSLADKAATSNSGSDTAMNYWKELASGTGSQATKAAIEANRNALAKQSANQRATTASAAANAGLLGQGAAAQAMQGTENAISQNLAASRLNELKILGDEQSDAISSLYDASNDEKSKSWDYYKALAASDNASDQAAAAKWLAENSSASGFQRADNSNALDAYATSKAENDPAKQLEELKAQQELKTQTVLANASNMTGYERYAYLMRNGLADHATAWANQTNNGIPTKRTNPKNVGESTYYTKNGLVYEVTKTANGYTITNTSTGTSKTEAVPTVTPLNRGTSRGAG